MRNLAGDKMADTFIAHELVRARIRTRMLHDDELRGEVPATIGGQISGPLGPIMLRRAWTYWVVVGQIPIAIAERLYSDPIGHDDIRAGGDCARRNPRDWSRDLGSGCVVETYHIDTEAGLRMFADTLNEGSRP